MTNNPIEIMIQSMIRQSGGNMQMLAQNILRSNPNFANAIQGQNLQQMAMSQMQNKGINPQQFLGNMPFNK